MRSNPIIIIDSAIVGGPGRGLFQLLNALKLKTELYLLCNFQYPRPKSMEFLSEARKNNFNIALLKERFRFDPLPFFEFLSLTKAGNYNLVQSHGYKSHLVAAVISWLTGLPWIAFTHGWTSEDKKVTLYHKLDKFLLRFPTVVIAVSPTLCNLFTKIRGPKKRTELVLNAVDSEAIDGQRGGQAIRNELGASSDTLLLGCFGRLSYEKGQDILLESFADISARVPEARLILLGDGIAQRSLEQLCERLDIKEKVFFVKHSAYIRDYYEAIDLLVLPSRSEGLPNVVLESMSFGIPVVATEVGAVKDIISNGINGWTTPANNKELMSECLLKVLADPVALKTIGRAGFDSLFPKFCPKARAEKIMKIYEEVCA